MFVGHIILSIFGLELSSVEAVGLLIVFEDSGVLEQERIAKSMVNIAKILFHNKTSYGLIKFNFKSV